jgi:hypothetical protein
MSRLWAGGGGVEEEKNGVLKQNLDNAVLADGAVVFWMKMFR